MERRRDPDVARRLVPVCAGLVCECRGLADPVCAALAGAALAGVGGEDQGYEPRVEVRLAVLR